MKYTQKDTKAYKLLSQSAKKQLKAQFKAQTKLPLTNRTIQRFFNDIKYTPIEYSELMKSLLNSAIIADIAENEAKIIKLGQLGNKLIDTNIHLTINL